MEKMMYYDKFRTVPPEAQKVIKGGRISGFTDINPMWRIKILTAMFGPCGVGWYFDVIKKWTETGANGEISAFVEVHLFYKHDGEWSRPVYGIGGSSFVAKESSGLRTSDECYKMAYTDAQSVACKALGVGADVYYSKDTTKYSVDNDNKPNEPQINEITIESVFGIAKQKNVSADQLRCFVRKKLKKEVGDLSGQEINKLHSTLANKKSFSMLMQWLANEQQLGESA